MQEWIDFDVDYRRFEIQPNAETPLGPTIVKIILDDTKDQTEYNLSIWINEAP